MLSRYFSSLRRIRMLMISFGLFMGAVFPFYSAFFFGGGAFGPLYVGGCLFAGLLVGGFCFLLVRQSLKINLNRQLSGLRGISTTLASEEVEGDELEALLDLHRLLTAKIEETVRSVSAGVLEISPACRELARSSAEVVKGSEEQIVRGREAAEAAAQVRMSVHTALQGGEELARRSEERAGIAGQLSEATGAIARNMEVYATSVEETAASIEEMARRVRETAQGMEEVSSSTRRTSTAAAEVGKGTVQVRDLAQNSARLAETVRRHALGGMGEMGETAAVMAEIDQASRRTSEAIGRLATNSGRVGDILALVQEVVAKTNLLALNASIIAAQAGEHGKSFAVVAEEVRSLAHRTGSSTSEIAALIEEIGRETQEVEKRVRYGMERTAEGVRLSARLEDSLGLIEQSAMEAAAVAEEIAAATLGQATQGEAIAEEAGRTAEIVQQVNGAIHDQERGAEAIVRSLERMRALSRSITASAAEQAEGNRNYLRGVQEDAERSRALREEFLRQLEAADAVEHFIRRSGESVEQHAATARENLSSIRSISAAADELTEKVRDFCTA